MNGTQHSPQVLLHGPRSTPHLTDQRAIIPVGQPRVPAAGWGRRNSSSDNRLTIYQPTHCPHRGRRRLLDARIPVLQTEVQHFAPIRHCRFVLELDLPQRNAMRKEPARGGRNELVARSEQHVLGYVRQTREDLQVG